MGEKGVSSHLQSNHEIQDNCEQSDLDKEDRYISSDLGDTKGCWMEKSESLLLDCSSLLVESQ